MDETTGVEMEFVARIQEAMKPFPVEGPDGGPSTSGPGAESQVAHLQETLAAFPAAGPIGVPATGGSGPAPAVTAGARSSVPSKLGPPQQSGGATTLERTFQDGSTQIITIDKDGGLARTTQRVNPSTGAEITEHVASDGTRNHREFLPGGDSTEVVTHPDGSTERIEFVRNSDGMVTMTSTGRDGGVTVIRSGERPDGTIFEERSLPDGRTELRTSKHTVLPDGSVVNETTGPEGSSREVANADASRIEVVFTQPDGRQSTSIREVKPDGSAVQTMTDVDGRRETVTTENLPGGGVREVWAHHDGSAEITTTSKNADGSTTVEINAPDRVSRSTTWPDGNSQSTVNYTDGTHELAATGVRPDGTKWNYTGNRDGSWEHIEQAAAGASTSVRRSDGTRVEYSVKDDITIITRRPDGSSELTDMTLDGTGTRFVNDKDGHRLSETHLEGETVEPFPDLTDPAPAPNPPDAFDQLDQRGVVGPGLASDAGAAAPEPNEEAVGEGTSDAVQPGVMAEPTLTAAPATDAYDDVLGVQTELVGSAAAAPAPELTSVDAQIPAERLAFESEPELVSPMGSTTETVIAVGPEPLTQEEFAEPSYAADPVIEAEPASDDVNPLEG